MAEPAVQIRTNQESVCVRYNASDGTPILVSVGCQGFRFGHKQAAATVEMIELVHARCPNSTLLLGDHGPAPRTFVCKLTDDAQTLLAELPGMPLTRRIPWPPLRAALLMEDQPAERKATPESE